MLGSGIRLFPSTRRLLRLTGIGVLLIISGILWGSRITQAQTAALPKPADFKEIAPTGFGDPENTGAWSMQWWRGKLYVGTARAYYCWVQAGLHKQVPAVPYPPENVDCPPDMRDLPLRGEIWRYTPETRAWERVYQSPADVPIPGSPGRKTARDIGYRGMAVFKEKDGTEALYVGAATSHLLWPPMPPPRILRSTDGVHFEPIPQHPGTVLGDLLDDQSTMRGMEVYKDRLFVLNGAIRGDGSIMEAANPAGGNDFFRWITPQDMKIYELAVFNGFLYLGTATDYERGYSVVKTDASGALPYRFKTVVPEGAFVEPRPSNSVVSMYVYKDRLYVGTNRPAELIRINPDDTWELLVGPARQTPNGPMEPLSGLDAGFDWPFNVHMWRMDSYNDVLYVGTLDQSTQTESIKQIEPLLRSKYGFDLYASADGVHFSPITTNGFGNKQQLGVRSFASSPGGLYMGTVSYTEALRVYRYFTLLAPTQSAYDLFLPQLGSSLPEGSAAGLTVATAGPGDVGTIAAPQRVEGEVVGSVNILGWERPYGGVNFRIFRAELIPNSILGIPDVDPSELIEGEYAEIGVTTDFHYADSTAESGKAYHYYVIAEDTFGHVSLPSNLARIPSLATSLTIAATQARVQSWSTEENEGAIANVVQGLGQIDQALAQGNAEGAQQLVADWRLQARQSQIAGLEAWRAEDLELMLGKLARRVGLVQQGLLTVGAVRQ